MSTGNLIDSTLVRFSVTSRLIESEVVPFGRVVSAGQSDEGCILGGTRPIGVAVKDRERPEGYSKGDTAGIARGGLVEVSVSQAVSAGDAVSYNIETGEIGNLEGEGWQVLPGARFETSSGFMGCAQVYLWG